MIIIQNRLGGAFFWQSSMDRKCELICATFNALRNDNCQPITTSRPLLTSTLSNEIHP
jgi:hypothetical protein